MDFHSYGGLENISVTIVIYGMAAEGMIHQTRVVSTQMKMIKNIIKANAKDGVIKMRISTIFFIFLGVGLMFGMPKSRRWITRNMINNTFLRRNAIRLGMSIPMIRKRVLREAMQGL